MNIEEVIASLSKEELINYVDSFLTYMNVEIEPDESLLNKIKKLKKIKNDLVDGKDVMEYIMGNEEDFNKISELSSKIEANNRVVVEVNLYIKYLSRYISKEEISLTRRLINKFVLNRNK